MIPAEGRWQGFASWTLDDGVLRAVVVPELGAKVVSLRSVATGREWLWQDPTRPLRAARLDAPFGDFDISGLDECFPAVGEGDYPLPGDYAGRPIADHGEVWSQPWSATPGPGSLVARPRGRRFSYVLARTLSFAAPGRLRFDYRVDNTGRAPLAHGWSAHPLFALRSGMRVLAPAGVRTREEFGIGPRIARPLGSTGPAAEHAWPQVNGFDLSTVEFPPAFMDKVVLSLPPGASVGIADDEGALTLTPGAGIPFVGICVDAEAYPFDVHPQCWIALEPTFASTDSLEESVRRGEYALVAPGATAEWSFTLEATVR